VSPEAEESMYLGGEGKDKPLPPEVIEARRQPKSPEEEARLAKKYAAIEDIGERAYTVLKDLYMI